MYKQELKVALNAVNSVRELILDIYNSTDLGVEIKEDNSPVTKADKAADKKIREILSTAFPLYSLFAVAVPCCEAVTLAQLGLGQPEVCRCRAHDLLSFPAYLGVREVREVAVLEISHACVAGHELHVDREHGVL